MALQIPGMRRGEYLAFATDPETNKIVSPLVTNMRDVRAAPGTEVRPTTGALGGPADIIGGGITPDQAPTVGSNAMTASPSGGSAAGAVSSINPLGREMTTMERMRRERAIAQPFSMSPGVRKQILGQIESEKAQAGEQSKMAEGLRRAQERRQQLLEDDRQKFIRDLVIEQVRGEIQSQKTQTEVAGRENVATLQEKAKTEREKLRGDIELKVAEIEKEAAQLQAGGKIEQSKMATRRAAYAQNLQGMSKMIDNTQKSLNSLLDTAAMSPQAQEVLAPQIQSLQENINQMTESYKDLASDFLTEARGGEKQQAQGGEGSQSVLKTVRSKIMAALESATTDEEREEIQADLDEVNRQLGM